jgi:hypothetical protein
VGLASCLCVSSTVPGVDDQIAKVLIVLVATGEKYRLCPLRLAPGYTGLEMPVNASRVKLCPILEKAAFWVPGYVTEGSPYHAQCSLKLTFQGRLQSPSRNRF